MGISEVINDLQVGLAEGQSDMCASLMQWLQELSEVPKADT